MLRTTSLARSLSRQHQAKLVTLLRLPLSVVSASLCEHNTGVGTDVTEDTGEAGGCRITASVCDFRGTEKLLFREDKRIEEIAEWLDFEKKRKLVGGETDADLQQQRVRSLASP